MKTDQPPRPADGRENDPDDGFLDAFTATNGFTLGLPTAARTTPDGKTIVFLRSGPRDRVNLLHTYDVASARVATLLEPQRVLDGGDETLTAEELARRERMRLQTRGFVDFEILPDGTRLFTSLGGRLLLVSLADGTIEPVSIGGPADAPKVSPDGRAVAYVRDGDLWVRSFDRGATERRLTHDASEDVTNGLAEFVAQEEMDRREGFWWSPDSRQIVFERADATGVERRVVVDETEAFQAPQSSPYPRPGKANVAVQLGVVAVTGGAPRWISWDRAAWPYLARVTWSKEGPLTLQVQSRDQKDLVVLVADPRTGATTAIHRERDEAWVNLHDGLHWFGHGQFFLWVTERSGACELEVRTSTGTLVRSLAGAVIGFRRVLDLDEEGGTVAFEAGTVPTGSSVWRVPLEGGEPMAIAREPGLHHAHFGDSHVTWIDDHRTVDALPQVHVRGADGSVLGSLPSVAEAPPLAVHAQIQRVGAGEGWYTAVLTPDRSAPEQRHPLVARVYGGPGHQSVVEDMMQYCFWQWFANQGFVVAFADNRGTPGRGRTFERAIRDRLADVPLADQVAAMRELTRRPDVDPERVGIVGWSYGGYLALLGVLRRPDFFRAGVAIAPVTDWADYDTHYTERYLGLPDEDPARYPQNSVLGDAPRLTRPLLLMHGTADDNVLVAHTLKLARELHRADRDFELVLFPGQTHMIADPVMKKRLWWKAIRFLRAALS